MLKADLFPWPLGALFPAVPVGELRVEAPRQLRADFAKPEPDRSA